MNVVQQKKILQRISVIETDIETLKSVRVKLATQQFVSATVSSGGGSRSYTRADLSKISEVIAELTSELKQLRRLLTGESGGQPGKILTIYL